MELSYYIGGERASCPHVDETCGVTEVLVPTKQTMTEGGLLVTCDGVVILVSPPLTVSLSLSI